MSKIKKILIKLLGLEESMYKIGIIPKLNKGEYVIFNLPNIHVSSPAFKRFQDQLEELAKEEDYFKRFLVTTGDLEIYKTTK